MREWFKKHKKELLKILVVVGVVAAIGVSSFFILRACGFTTKEDFQRLKNSLGDSLAFWSVIVALQIFQVIFIPISNSLISAPVSYIFENDTWKVFLSSWIGISIATIALYFIGKYGGQKILGWILGDKEKVVACQKFMQKGKAFFVLGDLIPFIPNDLLTVMSGMSGYSFLFVLVVTLITRAICIATTCWLFAYAKVYPWVWAILVALLVFMVFATIFIFRRQLKKEKENEVDMNIPLNRFDKEILDDTKRSTKKR